MKIHNVDAYVASLLDGILETYCCHCSSVPALVAYRLSINGRQMHIVGDMSNDKLSPIIINPVFPQELTFEDFTFFLVNSELNCVNCSGLGVEDVGDGVLGYVYRYRFDKPEDVEALKAGTLCIRNDEVISSSERKFDLNGSITEIELEFLFVRRNAIERLPVEFQHFREYKSWLTIGNSISPIGTLAIERSDTLSSISVELKDPRLREIYLGDLTEVVEMIKSL